jgi:hypothetical protein
MENNMSYLFNDTVGFKADVVDAFNRLKVANPFTLFDSQNRYKPNDKWDVFGITGGTYSYSIIESAVNLIVGTTLGSKISRETKRIFPYQPGKSLLVLNTFALNQPKEGLRQRIGYFGLTGGATSGIPYNGVYLQQSGLTLSMVMSSASLNTTITVNQADWNGDKFDGTGSSGRNLDVTKGNILWMDFEWLGVGDVRTGFYVDGKPVIAHTFHNDNINTTTYMTTACLPIRYELENLTGQTGSSQLKQICSSVISDGGYQGRSQKQFVSVGTKTSDSVTIGNGTLTPVLSIRLNSNRLDAIVLPTQLDILVTTADNIRWQLLLNATGLTGASWTTHSNGTIDYDTSTTAYTGGQIIQQGLAYQKVESTALGTLEDFNIQLGRSQSGVSDIITLVAAGAAASTAKILASLAWEELV